MESIQSLQYESRERPEQFTNNPVPWQMLSAAIIKKACEDYQYFSGQGRVRIEKFIRSEYFHRISDLDPDWLIKNLRECFPPKTGMIKGN